MHLIKSFGNEFLKNIQTPFKSTISFTLLHFILRYILPLVLKYTKSYEKKQLKICPKCITNFFILMFNKRIKGFFQRILSSSIVHSKGEII